MDSPFLVVPLADWHAAAGESRWAQALEEGRVLFLPSLAFRLQPQETALLSPALLPKGVRNISLDASGRLKGVAGAPEVQARVAGMIGRFTAQAQALLRGLAPAYDAHLRLASASLRPNEVATRVQSLRADDRRLHVDAFPTRPNRGERILRVFTNIDPRGQPRVWRIGEPFEAAARRFLPRARPYVRWQAALLHRLRLTKSVRSEYDHLMLQLHDRMKADEAWQRDGPQVAFPFPAGSTWVCFSDQTVHAAMSGQYLLEQTLHLPVERQHRPDASPLGILTRLAGHPLT